MVDAAADAHADGLETGLANQQEFIDAEIRSENAGRVGRGAHALQAFAGVGGKIGGHN